MNHQLRSLMLGDCSYYCSPYIHSVAQAMGRLGHLHSQIDLRSPLNVIRQRVEDVRPDVLWTHMLLWPPPGAPTVEPLIELCTQAAKRGTRVVIHDGDYKDRVRYPHDLSVWCSLALCNHTFPRDPWKIPCLKWPYCAFYQESIAPPDPRWACDLFFAGIITAPNDRTYGARSVLLTSIRERGVNLRVPSQEDGNTLFQTSTIAASATTVLGFGRPGVQGWTDTRVFQYPGAGAILLHDDVADYLVPWKHFVPYESGSAESVVEAVAKVKGMQESERQGIRQRAFKYVQEHHSSVARCREVLHFLKLSV